MAEEVLFLCTSQLPLLNKSKGWAQSFCQLKRFSQDGFRSNSAVPVQDYKAWPKKVMNRALCLCGCSLWHLRIIADCSYWVQLLCFSYFSKLLVRVSGIAALVQHCSARKENHHEIHVGKHAACSQKSFRLTFDNAHCAKTFFLLTFDFAMAEQSANKRRRQGQRQRLESVAAGEGSVGHSALATYLEEQWAWGYMSAQTIQRIAFLATQDMKQMGIENTPADLQKIGSFGNQAQNCNRDLLAVLSTKSLLPKVSQIHMRMKGGVKLQSVMLPHVVFHHLHSNYREYFFQFFMPGGEERLRRFWSNFEGHPSMAAGVLQEKPGYPAKMIPIMLHGDGVPTTGVGKVWAKIQLCFSWASILKAGSAKACSFLIWSAFEAMMDGQRTLDDYFEILSWSFEAMACGKWPQRNWKGEMLLGHQCIKFV